MPMKPLPIVLVLALAACESAPKIPVQPEEPLQAQEIAPQVDSSETPPLGYWKNKIKQTSPASQSERGITQPRIAPHRSTDLAASAPVSFARNVVNAPSRLTLLGRVPNNVGAEITGRRHIGGQSVGTARG